MKDNTLKPFLGIYLDVLLALKNDLDSASCHIESIKQSIDGNSWHSVELVKQRHEILCSFLVNSAIRYKESHNMLENIQNHKL